MCIPALKFCSQKALYNWCCVVTCWEPPNSFPKELCLWRGCVEWCSPGIVLYAQNGGGFKCMEGPAKMFVLGAGGMGAFVCLPDPAFQKIRFLECLEVARREGFSFQKPVGLMICVKQSCTDFKCPD